MAQEGVQLERETFSCSICLDLLKDPVTIPCGHSYCMTCINTHWDGEDQKGIHSCPQCRKTFRPRPDLEKNTMLAALVEELKKTGLQAAPADHHYAGPEDVSCDFCTGRKRKAVKSCLFCPASYCEKHLQPHYDVPPLKKHKLVEPSKNLQENICSRHDEVKKMFCRTDQQLICYLCSVEEHKGHDTVLAAAERTERQKELEVSRLNIQQRIQDRRKDVKLLQQELKDIKVSADKTLDDSWKILAAVACLIKNSSNVLHGQIRSQQETEDSRVRELQKKLEQEIRDLERKDTELKQLSDTPDHSQFLHNYPSVSALSESTHSSSISIRPLRHFEDVVTLLEELKEEMQDRLKDTWTSVCQIISLPDFLVPEPEPGSGLEPKTRAGFLRYSRDITLDPNTANTNLFLSHGDRKITAANHQQSYPDHPDRFSGFSQVLSRESLTGRCYWEVEMTARGFSIAVSYKSINRAENDHMFGCNDKSWALRSLYDLFTFVYNNTITPISGPHSSRIGVYLDHSAGILSFYSVSETMTLLHTVQTTFTEPLHAGILLYCTGDKAEIII
ncbi:tripartite motif-containing protein 16-like [Acanthochromis polyacanthus]|uniref:tripartite motif-containing protein 16-like n=1 Tax=Acanthochromis polyacanthus TaxID=80966 RepID=UPI002234364B|nr:tripartite motif-containing protein 16-like [Acanthochromis polyacanthus]XP_051809783.1 tripartite motif-containing protein 16-like [Acanthochromis polyacanthus]XP_051809784.1 tripartite motif-containing protein 16-like [Acanthochromis polyacanthus]XP_051809785.1 tripartite motif-containing protein 16-like [Acanthochromis polyacanthus]XP_051809786.1 tripartite motif-containing protein 16-like [Acanthochromis polyacanthus]XP_051809787.1 tripartite motif-containing protein 16-like [Acanthochr